jgi:hypothetical protein
MFGVFVPPYEVVSIQFTPCKCRVIKVAKAAEKAVTNLKNETGWFLLAPTAECPLSDKHDIIRLDAMA